MNTYIVRVSTRIDIDDDTGQRLWNERRIAIHFGMAPYTIKQSNRDSSSINADDYKGSSSLDR